MNDSPLKVLLQLKIDPLAVAALSELATYHRRGEYISALILSASHQVQLARLIAVELRALAERLES